MLKVEITTEMFNDETNEFHHRVDHVLELEHSLVSLSKWESLTEKAFLGTETKSKDELFEYIKCMDLKGDVTDDVLNMLKPQHFNQIHEYIGAKMSAAWFTEVEGSGKRKNSAGETITAELIYYWMISQGISKDFETWHLNKLFSLIKVCNEKNKPAKKMSRAEVAKRHRELNEKRRKQLGTSG